jgi:hypothetical protein
VISQAVLVSMSKGGRVAVEARPLPELYQRSREIGDPDAVCSLGGS